MAVILTCIFASCNKVDAQDSSFKVTIHPNNGQDDIVWDVAADIPSITKDGYHVVGYYLDADMTISTSLESLKATGLTKNVDVYVKWEKDACNHVEVIDNTIDPTCTTSGLTQGKHCSICGAILKAQTVIPAFGHSLEHHDGKEATCTEIGWNEYDTCKRAGCGYTTYQEIPALDHDMVHHERKEPTCSAIGWEAYDECTRCDYKVNYVELPKKQHTSSWWIIDVPATCDQDGHQKKICMICTMVLEEETIPAKHHSDTEWRTDKEPTCTETGDSRLYCKDCGIFLNWKAIPALGHDLEHHEGQEPTITEVGWEPYDSCKREGCEYTTYKEIPRLQHNLEHHDGKLPTCTEIGWEAYDTCTDEDCNYTTYKEIPALGHDLEHHEGKEPTITEVGWEPYDSCKREGCEYTTYKEIPRLQHNLEHHDGKLPTCTEIGWEAYDTCTDEDCNYTTYKEIPALGHDLEHHEGKEPTITEVGWEPYDSCKREGCDYTTYQEIPAHEHQESDWIIDVVGTCVENGTKHKECTVCHITMETASDTSGVHVHTNQSEENYLEATCTQEGYYEVVLFCLDCWQEVSRTPVVIPAKSHELEHHEAKAVTCTERGWDAYDTCKNCSYTTFVEIPAPGHVQDEWIIDIAPTCTTAGEKHVNCLVCGVLIERVGIKALGHSFADEWSFDENNHWKESTCGHDVTTPITPHSYDATWKCTECGYQDTNLHGTAIRAKTLQINGLDLYLSVSNSTSTFSFINEIEVADGAKFGVFTDLECSNEIRSKTCSLKIIGNNTFYILVENGNDIALYTVTIRRRPIYRVSFNSDGGTAVLDQQIEEDSFASLPEITPEKTGYTFTKWMFDFTTPITSNVTIQAQYTPIVYNINYVLKNGTHTNPQTYTIEDNYITFSDAEFEDKLFIGWYVKSTTVEGGYEYIAGFSSNKLTDITVYGAFYGTKGLVINGDTVTGYVGDSSTVVLPLVYKGVVIKNVAEDAFKDNKVIRRIETSSLYYSIPGSAFDGCDLDEIVNDVQVISDGEIIEEPTTDSDFVLAIVKTLGYTAPSDMYYSQDNCLITYVGKKLVLGANNSVIPSDGSVTSISAYAFAGRLGITDLTIPNGITSIGEYAFKNCVNIQSITLAQSVTDVATTAFYGCNATLLTGDASAISTIAKNHSKNTTYTVVLTGTSVPSESFKNCANLISVTIPNSVTSIGSSAFYNCTGLTSIYYTGDVASWCGISGLGYLMSSSSTLYIGGNKVEGELVIPDSVTSIGSNAFSYCTGLTSITIPDSVTSIGNDAFRYCNRLIEVYNKSTLSITAGSSSNGYVAYYAKNVYTNEGGSKLTTDENGYVIYTDEDEKILIAYHGTNTELVLPSYITKINPYAFYNCTGLTSVTIGNSVTSIGERAFSGCDRLQDIYITDIAAWCNISGLDNLMEYGASNKKLYINNELATSIIIPNGVKAIPSYAFYNCTGFTSVTIPNSVTSVGSWAFRGCTDLTSVTIPASVTSIGSFAFDGCTGLMSITVAKGNTKYHSAGNCLIETESKTLIAGCKNSIIPTDGSVTSIGNSAFDGCTGLTSVTIPDRVTSIDWYAFSGCTGLTTVNWNATACTSAGSYNYPIFKGCSNLATVTIGDNVKIIPSYAFHGCTGLTNVTIGNSVTSIGSNAFSGCTGLTSVTIPDSVTSIGSNAFYDCTGLTSVTIPDSVTSIGSNAFYDCTGLTSVTIGKGVTSIGSYAFDGCSEITSISGSSDVISKVAKQASPKSFVGNITSGTSVMADAFSGMTGLKGVTIPDSVTSIGERAFYECTGLTSVTIGKGVTSIGDYAFYGCYRLVEVYNKSTLSITAGSSSYGRVAYYAKNVYTTEGGSKLSTDENGYVIYTDEDEKILVAYHGTNTELVLPSYITEINQNAFYNCTGLTSVTIPDSVTSIGSNAFYDCTGLTSITIPDSVTSIDSSAFEGCTGLTSVTIGKGVTSIGNDAFEYCYRLIEVYNKSTLSITAGSSSNGYVAYYAKNVYTNEGGSKLTTDENGYVIYTDGDEKILVAYHGTNTELALPSYITKINQYAFYNCTGLTSVTIGNGVTSIGSSAFNTCSGLTSITIPDSVTSIGGGAFSYCTGLTSVTIGNSVTSIGDYAFSHCTGLTSITIPDSVTSIDWYAFSGCTGLTSVTIPDSVTRIGERAFYNCTGLTSVTIPDSVTSIGSNAFDNTAWYNNQPNGLVYAGKVAYKYKGTMPNNTSIVLKEGTLGIADDAFYDCTGLTSVTIPNSVTSIGVDAFSHCTGLTSVTIGNSVTSIGSYAFYWCTGLTNVTIPDSVTSIGSNAFYNTLWYNNQPNGLVYAGKVAYEYKGTMPSNASIVLEEGTLGIGGSAFYKCTGLTSITIPDSVTSIGYSAFEGCTGLTSIVIPDSVTSIGGSAFRGCTGLTSVTIGNSVTSIGNYAFSGCTGLTSVTIGNSVTSVGDSAFWGCGRLIEVYNKSTLSITAGSSSNGYVAYYAKNVYKNGGGSKLKTDENGYVIYTDGDEKILVAYHGTETELALSSYITKINQYAFYGCSSLTSITIPDSVTSIGSYTFYGCSSLTSITISDSVTSIGNFAFSGCSGLTSITFSGTIAQWNAISKGSYWNSNTGSYAVYCTDGTISKSN